MFSLNELPPALFVQQRVAASYSAAPPENKSQGPGLLTTGWACSFGSPDESVVPRAS
jgi:hypothetical protein